jgi:hypothetical protein
MVKGDRISAERMPSTITTISVHPNRAEKLREYRDRHDHPTLDAAVDDLLNQGGE